MSENNTESLVAYLDGELSPSESQQIEKQLAADGSVRNDIDALSRTWDMLDELDEVKASEEFTNKTLTSVQAAKSGTIRVSPATAIKSWLGTIAICAGIVAATFYGFRSASRPGELRDDLEDPGQQHQVLKHMPLLEKLHIYKDVDVGFAEKLTESGLFDE